MSSVAIITAVYPPEPVVSASMGQDLARELTRRSCDVTVLCPRPSRPIGADYSAFKRSRAPMVAQEEGVRVVRLASFAAAASGLAGRALESWSFGRHACRYLKHSGLRFDALYVNSWPLLSQALLARCARQLRIPMVLHIKDVYPDSMLLKLPPALRGAARFVLAALDRRTAHRAAAVLTISENMRRIYVRDRGIDSERVLTINDWHDEQLFARLPSGRDALREYGVPQGLFTFLYLGNIGPAAGVEVLMEAFCQAGLKDAQLLVIGGGSRKAQAEAVAARLGDRNIRFISDPEAENVPLLQSLAHVCLLPLKRGAAMSSIPSKLPAYMFSAKPVLASVDSQSDTARAVAEARCGWVEEPEDVQALARRMREVQAMPMAEIDRLGQLGRAYASAHYSKSVRVGALANVVLSSVRKAL
ncbi:MAG: glycosyltransferase family 4 protein [Limisphaerales bacterium]